MKVMNDQFIIKKIEEFKETYGDVFWATIEDQLYVYKAIGRKTYKDIALNKDLSLEDKKDAIVEACILIPEDYDSDEVYAGIPEILYKNIIDVSYLTSEDEVNQLTEYFRSEMFSLDNQITCIINEAFPQFDIEEIEDWGVERTAKYLSRAEYKLVNFRQFQFNDSYFNGNSSEAERQEPEQTQASNINKVDETKTVEPNNKKKKWTAEELAKLKQKFPEINWEADEGFKGIDGIREGSVDTQPVALRPIGGGR